MDEPTREPPAVRLDFCADCRDVRRDTIPVGHIERTSGPGYTVRACLCHARQRADAEDASQWLRTAVAALARRQHP